MGEYKVVEIPIEKLQPNDWNPNEMPTKLLNSLASNIEERGFLQPILVVDNGDGTYKIIDGEHRYHALKLLDKKTAHCVVVDSDKWSEDDQKFQTVFMNQVRGRLSKTKLRNLVRDLMENYSIDEIAERFGLEDDDYLRDLIREAQQVIPSMEFKRELDKAKEDIKTVEDLTRVINRLFAKYGHTIDHHYMVYDYGGKSHLWVRIPSKEDYSRLKEIADMIVDNNMSVSAVFVKVLSSIDQDLLNSLKIELGEVDRRQLSDELFES